VTGGLFCDGDFVMSYPRLSDQAAAVAAALVELGVSDDRVLVMLPDGPGFVDAFAGAMQEGAVPLPVNPLLSVREVVTVTTGGRCPVGGGLGRSDV
jgi:acyl-CoA synthetase (AMP-forming)/AMP-acid ligase II